MKSKLQQSSSCASDGVHPQPPAPVRPESLRRRLSQPHTRTVKDISLSPRYIHEILLTLPIMTMYKKYLGQLIAIEVLEELQYLRDSEKAFHSSVAEIETLVFESKRFPRESANEDIKDDAVSVPVATGSIDSPSRFHQEILFSLRHVTKVKIFNFFFRFALFYSHPPPPQPYSSSFCLGGACFVFFFDRLFFSYGGASSSPSTSSSARLAESSLWYAYSISLCLRSDWSKGSLSSSSYLNFLSLLEFVNLTLSLLLLLLFQQLLLSIQLFNSVLFRVLQVS